MKGAPSQCSFTLSVSFLMRFQTVKKEIQGQYGTEKKNHMMQIKHEGSSPQCYWLCVHKDICKHTSYIKTKTCSSSFTRHILLFPHYIQILAKQTEKNDTTGHQVLELSALLIFFLIIIFDIQIFRLLIFRKSFLVLVIYYIQKIHFSFARYAVTEMQAFYNRGFANFLKLRPRSFLWVPTLFILWKLYTSINK